MEPSDLLGISEGCDHVAHSVAAAICRQNPGTDYEAARNVASRELFDAARYVGLIHEPDPVAAEWDANSDGDLDGGEWT